MKKILIILCCVGALFAQTTTTKKLNTEGIKNYPINNKMFTLFDGVAGSGDTLTDSCYFILGPFPLAPEPKDPQGTSFALYNRGLTGTTPNVIVSYAFSDLPGIDDTISEWTTLDTIGSTTESMVFSTTQRANYLWIRFYNDDTTAAIFGKKTNLIIYRPTETHFSK